MNAIKELLNNIDILKCPFCESNLKLTNNSLICINKHTFDISKKGEICLYKTSKLKYDKIYDKDLFINRREFIKLGFYDDIHKYIYDVINKLNSEHLNIVDFGCGEGTHDIKIKNNIKINNNFIGIDISRDGIKLATDYIGNNLLPILGDIHNVPIKDKSVDIILNILSPSNEKEIKRILKDDGLIIKIIPQKKYLEELRKLYNIKDYEADEELYFNINNKYNIIDEYNYQKVFDININDLNYLYKMTPLLKNNIITSDEIKQITIDLKLLILKLK
ncbi:MAG: methyltransferase domain-containing protein [Bacilli bacterium]|nr:methyltransferase domain-containing protein [Bacilli bacterium]